MKHFNATLTTKDTSKNVRSFVKEHKTEFHILLKQAAPYLIILSLCLALHTYITMKPLVPEVIKLQGEIIQSEGSATALHLIKSYRIGVERRFEPGVFISSIILHALIGYIFAVIAISWHRLVLLGSDNSQPMSILKPEKHEIEFILVLTILSTLIPSVFGYVQNILLWGKGTLQNLALIPAFTLFYYVVYKICFYFPAKAVGSSMSFGESYSLTFGYFWKFSWANIRAIIRVVGLAILCYIAALVLRMIIKAIFLPGLDKESSLMFDYVSAHAIGLPFMLYFSPLMTVLGVTVLSNYYQHALQNKPEALSSQE